MAIKNCNITPTSNLFGLNLSQSAFTCSKSTMETPTITQKSNPEKNPAIQLARTRLWSCGNK